MSSMRRWQGWVLAAVLLAACSKDTADPVGSGGPSGDGEGDGDQGGEESPDASDGDGDDNDDEGPGDGDGDGDAVEPGCPDGSELDAELTGRVLSPNLQIPISGALVYVTTDEVPEISDGTYCSRCVELTCHDHFVLSAADGSFTLPLKSGEKQTLVVQKGEFRRVIALDVKAGSEALEEAVTSLPGKWAPEEGQWIPRIAVYETIPDAVYNVLAKFGLGTVNEFGDLERGTESFDLIPGDVDGTGEFLDDAENLAKYHIVFVPCAATKEWYFNEGFPINTVSALRMDNVRKFVADGGKWYVTDHSNEYIEEPFPDYLEFYSPDMPDIQPAYSSTGRVVDEGMLAWLEALPAEMKDIGGGNETLLDLPAITTRDNFTGIDQLGKVTAMNAEGEEVDVSFKPFVEGPCPSCFDDPARSRPMAVSAQYGCGRMMFSTFETSSAPHLGLTPQELALLYMILEIGVCQTEPDVVPPVL